MTETSNPVGRPCVYDPAHCNAVIELGRAGKSFTQIACALDISRETLYAWRDKFPEFSDALTRAREFAQCWWEDAGQIGLFAEKFQASLWAKQVSCRFPDDYRENTHQLTGANGEPLNQKPELTLLSQDMFNELLTISQRLASAGVEGAVEPGEPKV